MGQARKSLWIETSPDVKNLSRYFLVRLVRACGSKHYRTNGMEELSAVRLVRACGSKPYVITNRFIVIWVRLVRACGSKLRCISN